MTNHNGNLSALMEEIIERVFNGAITSRAQFKIEIEISLNESDLETCLNADKNTNFQMVMDLIIKEIEIRAAQMVVDEREGENAQDNEKVKGYNIDNILKDENAPQNPALLLAQEIIKGNLDLKKLNELPEELRKSIKSELIKLIIKNSDKEINREELEELKKLKNKEGPLEEKDIKLLSSYIKEIQAQKEEGEFQEKENKENSKEQQGEKTELSERFKQSSESKQWADRIRIKEEKDKEKSDITRS